MASDQQGLHLCRRLRHTGYTRDNSFAEAEGKRRHNKSLQVYGGKQDTKVNETIIHYFKPTGPRNHEKRTNRKYERTMEEQYDTQYHLIPGTDLPGQRPPKPNKEQRWRAWKNSIAHLPGVEKRRPSRKTAKSTTHLRAQRDSQDGFNGKNKEL